MIFQKQLQFASALLFDFRQEAIGVLAFKAQDAPFQTHHRKDKEVEILGFESPKVR